MICLYLCQKKINIYYHQLKDLLNKYMMNDNTTFYEIAGNLINFNDPIFNTTSEYWIDKNSNGFKLWQLVCNRHGEDVIYSDSKEEIKDENKRQFINSFYSLWQSTYAYYTNLINIYKNQENKLLERLSSTTEFLGNFNDTPQTQGDYSGEGYTTNITKNKSTTTSDVSSLMSRIAEIQDKYRNIWGDWCKEFDKLFTPYEQYYGGEL